MVDLAGSDPAACRFESDRWHQTAPSPGAGDAREGKRTAAWRRQGNRSNAAKGKLPSRAPAAPAQAGDGPSMQVRVYPRQRGPSHRSGGNREACGWQRTVVKRRAFGPTNAGRRTGARTPGRPCETGDRARTTDSLAGLRVGKVQGVAPKGDRQYEGFRVHGPGILKDGRVAGSAKCEGRVGLGGPKVRSTTGTARPCEVAK